MPMLDLTEWAVVKSLAETNRSAVLAYLERIVAALHLAAVSEEREVALESTHVLVQQVKTADCVILSTHFADEVYERAVDCDDVGHDVSPEVVTAIRNEVDWLTKQFTEAKRDPESVRRRFNLS